MEEKKQKLLLIKLSSLGDVIFNIPLANALKNAGYEITWLVSEKGIQVVENNPCVDKTILVPIKKWKSRGFCLENFKEYLANKFCFKGLSVCSCNFNLSGFFYNV